MYADVGVAWLARWVVEVANLYLARSLTFPCLRDLSCVDLVESVCGSGQNVGMDALVFLIILEIRFRFMNTFHLLLVLSLSPFLLFQTLF